jgi:hypothetical protein
MALLAANRLRLDIARLTIGHAEAVRNFDRVQQMHDEIVDAIAAWSPELVQCVLGILNRVPEAWYVQSS